MYVAYYNVTVVDNESTNYTELFARSYSNTTFTALVPNLQYNHVYYFGIVVQAPTIMITGQPSSPISATCWMEFNTGDPCPVANVAVIKYQAPYPDQVSIYVDSDVFISLSNLIDNITIVVGKQKDCCK
jgi:hypothetical protein